MRWRSFTAWCAARGALALAARPRVVLLHPLAMERERADAAAIDAALCAIRTAHELRHYASPADSDRAAMARRQRTDEHQGRGPAEAQPDQDVAPLDDGGAASAHSRYQAWSERSASACSRLSTTALSVAASPIAS
ncbi:hypothetical protein [Sorangium sp. So ce131]|uniref:hypothetical protein n=1 Tax=Sorangium sp. So ce131 TaxID=3133282 RepID=UPI003F62D7C1